MSFLPLPFGNPYSIEFRRPSRILDQQFGLSLTPEDLLAPFTVPRGLSIITRCPAGYIRPWRSPLSEKDAGSTIQVLKDKFEANLDVQQFAPEEITVKVVGDNMIVIEGKHEEKQDEHGTISRHFMRKYILPEGCDLDRIESKMSSDGVLTIIAPRIPEEQAEQREVPVKRTGQPSKTAEAKKEEAGGDNH